MCHTLSGLFYPLWFFNGPRGDERVRRGHERVVGPRGRERFGGLEGQRGIRSPPLLGRPWGLQRSGPPRRNPFLRLTPPRPQMALAATVARPWGRAPCDPRAPARPRASLPADPWRGRRSLSALGADQSQAQTLDTGTVEFCAEERRPKSRVRWRLEEREAGPRLSLDGGEGPTKGGGARLGGWGRSKGETVVEAIPA